MRRLRKAINKMAEKNMTQSYRAKNHKKNDEGLWRKITWKQDQMYERKIEKWHTNKVKIILWIYKNIDPKKTELT